MTDASASSSAEPPQRPGRAVWVAAIPACAGLALAAQLAARSPGLPLDDAWIHLDYARSLVTQQTFGYTPGGWENGSTAPLWTLVLGVPLALGSAPAAAARWMSVLSLALLLVFAFRATAVWADERAAVVAVAVTALDPWVLALSVSGMETVAAMAAAFASLDAYARHRVGWTGVALAVAGGLRPELGLLTPALALSMLLERRGAGRVARLVAAPVAAAAVWMGFGLATTGRLLPNTFWVKTRPEVDLAQQLDALSALFLGGPLPAVTLVGVAIATGLVVSIRRRPAVSLATAAVPLAILAFYVATVGLGLDRGPMAPASAENVYSARLPLLILPWLILWFATGSIAAWDRIAAQFGPNTSLAVAAVALALTAPSWWSHRDVLARAHLANCAEIEALQVQLGHWVRDELPPDAVVGVSDAGAIRYFGERETIDLVGLNTHELLDAPDPVAWLLGRGVTHLIVWPAWHRELLASPRLRVRALRRLRVEEPTMVAGREMVVFEVTGS